jgi:hypothetical protein
MAICGGCNAQTTRIHITMTSAGGRKLLAEDERKEICPNCCPEFFAEAFAAPSDRKIWDEAAAMPHLYHLGPDGSLELNDSPKADLMAKIGRDTDLETAIEWKRRNRRTEPMTPDEIAAADALMRPAVTAYIEDTKKQVEADVAYTENLIENMMREERAKELVQ